MEYVITSEQSFDEIEALTITALERHGLVVHRTFSLHSAAGTRTKAAEYTQGSPGFSVLMLYTAGRLSQPVGLFTLYQRGARTVIVPALTADSADMDADLVGALLLADLGLCVEVSGSERCSDVQQSIGRTRTRND